MTHAEHLAEFVTRASWEDLSPEAREALKLRILDSLGCALGAIEGEPIRMLRSHLAELGGREICTLIGGGRTALDRAALYNGALVRYLDFNDSYLAPGETCHPSDNLAAVVAASEYAGGSGRDLLVALAVAYQVQCRLSDVAPVRDRGFDHVTHIAFSAAAGAAKALGLDRGRTANAIALAAVPSNALRVTRTGRLSHWKGLAAPYAGSSALHAALLAARGITGPAEVFEGNKGWRETVSGPWELDWSTEDLERVRRTILKKYDAEVHSQAAIEGLLELLAANRVGGEAIDSIDVAIFDVAHRIIGGGEEGAKTEVATKEEADHSLPYILAVTALDGDVMPEQYEQERIRRADVQSLLRRVRVEPHERYSRLFPERHACRLTVYTKDGARLEIEKQEYEGFHTRPMAWAGVERKFLRLASGAAGEEALRELIQVVRGLEEAETADLVRTMAGVGSRPA